MKRIFRPHYYKVFEIQRAPGDKRPAFTIRQFGGQPVDATTSLRSAKWLIDVWDESRFCACGEERLPHDYRCQKCKEGRKHGAKVHGQHRRVG